MRMLMTICGVMLGSVLLEASGALAGDVEMGPVVLGYVERLEYHSNAPGENYYLTGDYGPVTYLNNVVFATRKLDNHVSGMLTYINKYDLDANETATHIGNVSIFHDRTRHWRLTYSFSLVTNPERAVTGRVLEKNDTGWAGFGAEHTSNPGNRKKATWKSGIIASTATDVAASKTITGKFGYRAAINPKTTLNATYQAVFGFADHNDPMSRQELYANQIFLALDRNISANSRLQLEYQYIDNEYNGNLGDDSVARLSWMRFLKTK